jgi:hypothetical protein
MRVHNTMTLQEAKSIARHLGLTLRQVRSGAYRVNFPDGSEATAYYADDLEHAVNTAVEMARSRSVIKPVDETAATRQAPSRQEPYPMMSSGSCTSPTLGGREGGDWMN